MNTQTKIEQPTQGETTYRTPEITDFGNIETLTLSGGSFPTDVGTGVSSQD